MTNHRLDESASGVFIISATPFTDDGSLDLESARCLADFYIEKGVSGITILGMMGEAQKLSPLESEQFLTCILTHINGRVPVIVGVSNAGTDNLVYLAKLSMDKGAAGVMIAPVPGLGTEQKIYNYYNKVFSALDDIPVCYQDYPFATRSEISVPLFNRLVSDFDQLVMLKLTPHHTIVDAVAAIDRMDAPLLESLLVTHEMSGLRVLPAPLEPAFADQVGAAEMVANIEHLRTF